MGDFKIINRELNTFNDVCRRKFNERRFMGDNETNARINDFQDMRVAFLNDIKNTGNFEINNFSVNDDFTTYNFYIFKNKITNEVSVLLPETSGASEKTDIFEKVFYQELEKIGKNPTILTPLCENSHWTLKVKKNNEQYIVNSSMDARQIGDGFSCGIYTMQAVASLVLEGSNSNFSPKNYSAFSERQIASLSAEDRIFQKAIMDSLADKGQTKQPEGAYKENREQLETERAIAESLKYKKNREQINLDRAIAESLKYKKNREQINLDRAIAESLKEQPKQATAESSEYENQNKFIQAQRQKNPSFNPKQQQTQQKKPFSIITQEVEKLKIDANLKALKEDQQRRFRIFQEKNLLKNAKNNNSPSNPQFKGTPKHI